SPVPVTHQLEAMIRGQIVRGDLRPGDRLPTEHELCAQLGISRTPVRRALGELTARGLLVRYPGRGTFVAANAGVDEPQEVTELWAVLGGERWCWPLQRGVAAWNAEHPERPVRLRFDIVEKQYLRSRITLAVAEGTATDISLVDSAWVAEFADRGYLQSFDAIEPRLAAQLTADLLPPLRQENSFNGDLYAFPPAADVALLWYRKDWFAREELAPPRTWDEWLHGARHFQKDEVRRRYGLGQYSVTFAGGAAADETTTFQLLPVLWSAGADVIANNEVVLNSPAARNAVEFIADLVRRHRVAASDVVNIAWNGPPLALASGAVAFALGGSYERTLIKSVAGWDDEECQERLAFVPIPAGPGGQPATLLGGMAFAIQRQSRHQDLALQILARASDGEILREFSKRNGENPPTLAANEHLTAETEPYLHAAAQLVAHARARWPLPEYSRVSAQIGRMFETAIVGELEPDQAVARAAAVISGITGLPERGSRRATWSVPTRVSRL
ncbi:MAG: multiple sugar transport system substrate-binding protein, partial [Thermomicrobiales bacterium]|nr:multiple sugar transport system substrate-binding protein [Thermomicrobiales bacterium]